MERAGGGHGDAPPPPPPPPPQKTCRLLSGPAAAAAQLSLALVVAAALLLRRSREQPRRPARVFAFDVSKQFVSSGAAHVSGLIFAVLAAGRGRRGAAAAAVEEGGGSGGGGGGGRGTGDGPSECGFYLVVFVVDTLFGSLLAIAMHRACVSAAVAATARRARKQQQQQQQKEQRHNRHQLSFAARFSSAVARCGEYSSSPQQPERPQLSVFVPQLIEWTLCVVAARVACGLFVLAASQPVLSGVASGIDGLFGRSDDGGGGASSSSSRSYHASLELFFVMLAGPLAMNAAQALVQDAVLRSRAKGGATTPSSSSSSSSSSSRPASGGGGATTTSLNPSSSFPPPSSSTSSSSPYHWEDEGAELLPSPPSHHRS